MHDRPKDGVTSKIIMYVHCSDLYHSYLLGDSTENPTSDGAELSIKSEATESQDNPQYTGKLIHRILRLSINFKFLV